MSSAIQLLLELWGHVGPGLLLALALPLFLIVLGMVFLTGLRRLQARTELGD